MLRPTWVRALPPGLWYRPWMRRATWVAFTLISVVSMILGFWDLYRSVLLAVCYHTFHCTLHSGQLRIRGLLGGCMLPAVGS